MKKLQINNYHESDPKAPWGSNSKMASRPLVNGFFFILSEMIFAPLAVVLPIYRGQIQVKRKICLKIIGPVQVKKPVRFGSCITPIRLLNTYIFFEL